MSETKFGVLSIVFIIWGLGIGQFLCGIERRQWDSWSWGQRALVTFCLGPCVWCMFLIAGIVLGLIKVFEGMMKLLSRS